MKSIRGILEYPPTKKIECNRCNGSGMINIRGMVSSDDCPKCDATGKIDVPDNEKIEEMIREFITLEDEEELPVSEVHKKACAKLRKNFKI